LACAGLRKGMEEKGLGFRGQVVKKSFQISGKV
jgi:hypothetical protein